MKYLSFDVGIKNLAYCIMYKDNTILENNQNLKVPVIVPPVSIEV